MAYQRVQTSVELDLTNAGTIKKSVRVSHYNDCVVVEISSNGHSLELRFSLDDAAEFAEKLAGLCSTNKKLIERITPCEHPLLAKLLGKEDKEDEQSGTSIT